MPQYARISPQPLTEAEEAYELDIDANTLTAKAKQSGIAGNAKAVKKIREERAMTSIPYRLLLPSDVEDQAAIVQLAQRVVPSIIARKNVTLLLLGHPGGGKSCLIEQLLPVIMDGIKGAVIAANEAHQELLTIGGESALQSVHRKPTRASPQEQQPAEQMRSPAFTDAFPEGDERPESPDGGPAAGAQRRASINDNVVVSGSPSKALRRPVSRQSYGGSPSRRATSPVRSMSAMSRASSIGSPSKYSLMMARLPRDSSTIEVAEVDVLTEPFSTGKRLLPDLDGPEMRRKSSVYLPPAETAEPSNKGLMRKTLLRSRSPIEYSMHAIAHLYERNGRRAEGQTTLQFANNFYMRLPFIKGFDGRLKTEGGAVVQLWVCANGETGGLRKMSLFHIYDPSDPNYNLKFQLNTNHHGGFEAGFSLITMRDGQGKMLECGFNDNICDGNWHHVRLEIAPSYGHLMLLIDGKSLRPKVSSSEKPSVFHESRPKAGLLGASMELAEDGGQEPGQHFDGFMYDLVFGDMIPGIQARYPLVPSAAGDGTTFPDSTGNCEAADPINQISFKSVPFVATSVVLEGQEASIPVGPVGDFGIKLGCFNVDFWVKCSVTTEPMTVMGVVDSRGKHQKFIVDVNRNSQGLFQRCQITLTIQDVLGNILRCCIDAPDMFDDRWHSVQMKVVDASYSKFKAKIDNKHADSHTWASQMNPIEFVGFEDPIVIGCLNDRGVNRNHFKGSLRNIKLSETVDDAEKVIAFWPMDEGPGARIAVDSSQHGFNGAYFLTPKLKGLQWLPMADLAVSEEESQLDNIGDVVRHSNNMVTIAYVAVTHEVTPNGQVKEQLHDLLNGGKLDTDLFSVTQTNPRLNPNDPRYFATVPEECFREITPVDFMNTFKNGLHKSEEFPRSHIVCVLRLGDALFTAIDTVGFIKSSRAKFSASQMQWSDAVNTFGATNKINNRLNHGVAKTEKLLTSTGSRPQLFKRTAFMRKGAASTSDNVLTNIAMNALCSGKELADLHVVHVLSPNASRDELLNTIVVSEALERVDRDHAAVMIQKTFRKFVARGIYHDKNQRHLDDAARKERIAQIKNTFPVETGLKIKRHVIIINCTSFLESNDMPQVQYGFDDIRVTTKLWEQLGFTSEVLTNPSKEVLLQGLNEHKRTHPDQFLIVYFIGVSIRGGFRKYETHFDHRYWFEEVQIKARDDIQNECIAEYTELQEMELAGFNDLQAKAHEAAEEAARKAKKKKKKKAAPRRKSQAPEGPVFTPIPHEPHERLRFDPQPPPGADAALEGDASHEGEQLDATQKSEHLEATVAATQSTEAPPPVVEEGAAETQEGDLNSTKRSAPALSAAATPATGNLDGSALPTATEPLDSGHTVDRNRYFLMGNASADINENNTLAISELEELVVGLFPRRGDHSLFMYDTVTIDAPNSPDCNGFGGIVSSSTEAIHFDYEPYQRFLLGYYLKKILQGCAVECVRIGRHEPPSETTMEIAMKYLMSKMGPKKPFAVERVTNRWYGEYVGDVLLAPKLLTLKHERRATKRAPTNKRFATRVSCMVIGNFIDTFRGPLLSEIAQIARIQLPELKRVSVHDSFEVELIGDYNLLTKHPLVQDEIRQSLKKYFPEDRINFHIRYGEYPVLVISPVNPRSPIPEDIKKELKASAQFFVKDQDRYLEEINQYVEHTIGTLADLSATQSKIGRFPVSQARVLVDLYVSLTEDEALRVERAARTGMAGESDQYVMLSATVLADNELADYEQVDKYLAADEARKQAEAKLRLVAEAEARKKAEERAAKMRTQRDGMIIEIEESRAVGKLEDEVVDRAVVLPLPEVYCALFDAATSLGSAVAGQAIARAADRLGKAIDEEPPARNDQRLQAAAFKMVSALGDNLPVTSGEAVAIPFVAAALAKPVPANVKPLVTILSRGKHPELCNATLAAAVAKWDVVAPMDAFSELATSAARHSVVAQPLLEAVIKSEEMGFDDVAVVALNRLAAIIADNTAVLPAQEALAERLGEVLDVENVSATRGKVWATAAEAVDVTKFAPEALELAIARIRFIASEAVQHPSEEVRACAKVLRDLVDNSLAASDAAAQFDQLAAGHPEDAAIAVLCGKPPPVVPQEEAPPA